MLLGCLETYSARPDNLVQDLVKLKVEKIQQIISFSFLEITKTSRSGIPLPLVRLGLSALRGNDISPILVNDVMSELDESLFICHLHQSLVLVVDRKFCHFKTNSFFVWINYFN